MKTVTFSEQKQIKLNDEKRTISLPSITKPIRTILKQTTSLPDILAKPISRHSSKNTEEFDTHENCPDDSECVIRLDIPDWMPFGHFRCASCYKMGKFSKSSPYQCLRCKCYLHNECVSIPKTFCFCF